MNQNSKGANVVADAKRGEVCANESQLFLVLLLTGLHKEASFVKPILSGGNAKR